MLSLAGTVLSIRLSSTQCCAALSGLFPANVYYPNSTVYVQEESTYYSALQAEQDPACRVVPTSAEKVAQVVQLATENNCIFAVRSGGHMNWKGSSNVGPAGFTIDLQQLNQISLSSDHSTLSVGPGALWGQVYDLASPLNLTVLGGRVSTVGVGGFLVGGGIGYLSYQYGLAPAYITEYEIVLANGTFVNASSENNAALHWALALGSTNFGVVTQYTLETFALGGMWGGALSLGIQEAPAVMDYFLAYVNKLADDPKGLSSVTMAWNSTAQDYGIFIGIAYLLPVSFPPLFSGLEQLIPNATENTLEITNLTAIATSFADADPSGYRQAWWTLTFEADTQLVLDVQQYGRALFADLLAVNGTQWSLNVQPINHQMITATQAANNPAGLEGENLFLILEHLTWEDPTLDEVMEDRSRDYLAWAEALARERGLLNRFLYLNYADGHQPIYAQIGLDNLEKLQAVKNDYDPDNAMGRLWLGGFKF
ncbi:FAD-binding domain-containing protein [Laetiporus sulphureus 93-53]|uniref:FAD-binding domain-containing protein n=1 Tax=Laetiporus sulphureus 93-53 TaxID=1314785 RepID=A0A165DHI3_9APHY|nr:FAD-binding domain-containing protein [Laetiporus sulphureus 93-53]KZT04891.1 FAD-binding domain-containing protein [Laetiporus sulphureus 93-53]